MKIEYVPTSDFGTVITGKTPSTIIDEYWDGEIPFITPTDINGYDVFYLDDTKRHITESGAFSQKKTILDKDAICVTCIGSTIGKICITKAKSVTNQQINSIVVNENYDPKYVFYTFRNNLDYIRLIGSGTGSGKPIINKTKFCKIKYPVITDLNYQIKVSSLLSKYDELIGINNRQIKALAQTAEEIYKEWFVRYRFPSHEKATLKKDVPKGWVCGKESESFVPINWHYGELSEIGKFKRGKNLKIEEMVEGDIPVISAGLSPSGFHNQSNVKGKSLTISASGANAGYLKCNLTDIWASDCSYYQNDKNIWFVYCSLRFIEKAISNLQIGAAQPHVYPKNINRLSILIPEKRLINDFNEIVTPIFEKIRIISIKNNNLVKQRDMLLPRLMSGKTKV